MRTHALLAVAVAVPIALAGGVGTGCAGTPSDVGDNAAHAVGFDRPRDNPYYPLRPGTTTRLRGSDAGERFTETVVVTDRTETIQHVRTRVVSDVVRRADGSVSERTSDYYAADDRGTVWYFGEDTATYDRHGHVVSREGTWRAGREGARRGVIMTAHPAPGHAYRQEFRAGHAEDQAWIVQNDARVRVPARDFANAVRSLEWSRLEPGVVSVKFYAAGVGIVKEQDVAGGNETFELVSVTRG